MQTQEKKFLLLLQNNFPEKKAKLFVEGTQPCLHTLMQTRVSANQSARTVLDTPNCNNVVVEKGKSQIGIID